MKIKTILSIAKYPNLALKTLYYIFKRTIYDYLCFLNLIKYKHSIIFIAGLPLSGSTYVKNFFANINGYFSRGLHVPLKVHLRQDITNDAFKKCKKYNYTLFKTHLNPKKKNLKILKENNVKKIIITYRDLRDVIVSRYFRLKAFPKNKKDPLFFDYNKHSKEDSINHNIKIIKKYYIPWLENWFKFYKKNKDFIFFCKYEDLRKNPKKNFKKLLKFYSIELSEKKIFQILEKIKGKKNMKENFSRAWIMPTALASNFRSGKVNDWKNHFSKKNKKFCNQEIGKYLKKLGYAI